MSRLTRPPRHAIFRPGDLSPVGREIQRHCKLAVMSSPGDRLLEFEDRKREIGTSDWGTAPTKVVLPYIGPAADVADRYLIWTGRPSPTEVTFACVVQMDAANANVMGTHSGAGSNGNALRVDGNGDLTMLIRSGQFYTDTSITIANNAPYFLAATWSDGEEVARLVARRLDTGSEQFSSSTVGGATLLNDGTWYVGGHDWISMNGKIGGAWILDSALNMDTLRAWAADPWALHRTMRATPPRIAANIAPPANPQVKYWNGSAWTLKDIKYWNGSAWAAPSAVNEWNGSAWVQVSP